MTGEKSTVPSLGLKSQLHSELYDKDLGDVVDHKLNNNKEPELVTKKLTQSLLYSRRRGEATAG